MVFLRIHCDSCGGKWEVYRRDIYSDHSRQCPHCFREIDRQTWDKNIVPAIGFSADANNELSKDHADGKPPFRIDIVSCHLAPKAQFRTK